jgi:hypothetical protein
VIELNERTNAGLTVRLFWDESESVFVSVAEGESEPTVSPPIDKSLASEAFHHPYLYLPRESVSAESETEGTELNGIEVWHELRATSSDLG